MSTIYEYLERQGPSRSSHVAEWLVRDQGLTAEAARKRLSRIQPPLRKFPVALLPKGESFVYHQDQRSEERFWSNFQQAMRSTGSLFGAAIDGLLARHGVVRDEEFAVISGATATALKGQLLAKSVADRLIHAGVVERRVHTDGKNYINILRNELCFPDWDGMDGRQLTEGIILEGFREWARKLGMASYNLIKIRGEPDRRPVGPFMFDLAGPSYLLPFQISAKQPGFLVADVFVDATLDEFHIAYFIRKTSMLHALLRKRGAGALAVLVADGFTGSALKAGHAAGVLLATPKDLFGQRAGKAIQTLLQTLHNAAAYASSAPERLTKLIDELSEIEGAAGNIRGILFELLAAYLVRRDAVSIDMGKRARDPKTGKTADIDILKFTSQNAECVAIECKGKIPGGSVTLEEAQDWIRRLPIFQAHLRAQSHLKEANLAFELWTSGAFDSDALDYLNIEKTKRIKFPITWKNGLDVLAVAHKAKEKAIADALNQHFIKHPLVEVTVGNLR